MAVKFKIQLATEVSKAVSAKRNEEVERAKEHSRKYPDKYLPVIDAVEIPIRVTENGTRVALKIVVQRDGNDNDEDIENPLCLDVRTYIRRPGEKEQHTKSGIHIPYRLANHLANTILEICEDVEAKRAAGEKF